MPEHVLFGRSYECARIDALLAAACEGKSGAMVLRGHPGTGKTALCKWAMSRNSDLTVIAARGVQSESELAFAGLLELLRPLLEHIDDIPPPQAAALSGALALTSAVQMAPFVINTATLSLITAGAEAAPLLAVVDDAHWLDAPSIEALTFTARRIEADGVAMLFAVRDGEQVNALDVAELPELRIDELDRDAARALLESASSQIAPAVADHVISETGGNPLALVEILETLNRAQLRGHVPLDDPLPIGPHLGHLFGNRLTALPDDTRRALLVAAASGTRSLATVIPAVVTLGLQASDLEPAEQAGLLRLHDGELEVRHPVLRSTIYYGAPATQVRAAHAALARVVVGDRRAWHLAGAVIGPDESVAKALESAGHNAWRRGGFATAAATYERAATRTITPELRARRLLDAASGYEVAGRFDAAAAVLDTAAELATDPQLRADIGLQRGRVRMWSGDIRRAHALLLDEAAGIEDVDPARATLLYAEAVMSCYMSGHITDGVASAQRAHELGSSLGGHAATMGMLVSGHSLVLSGESVTGGPRLLKALALFDEDVPLSLQQWFGYAGQCLTWLEEFTRARAFFDRMIAEARQHSALPRLSYALMIRSELDFRTGHWTRAYADSAESIRLARELGQVGLLGAASASLSFISAAKGRDEDCRTCVARTLRIGAQYGFASFEVYAAAALGSLELSLGHPQQAINHLEPLIMLVDRLGLGEPATVLWTPDLIEAYIRTGQHATARQTLKSFASQARRTGRTWALAAAARCTGMLAADAADCDESFDEALRFHDGLAMPFERARTRLCYGEQLRRANRRVAAREQLRDAATTFDSLDAAPWSQRARAELLATGARPDRRRPSTGADALTPQELQVALAVAQGLSNKETAATLFLSPKTVEFHLSNTYRKLGVNSRTRLANHFASSTRHRAMQDTAGQSDGPRDRTHGLA